MQENTTTRCYHHFTELEQRFIRRFYATTRTCFFNYLSPLTSVLVAATLKRRQQKKE